MSKLNEEIVAEVQTRSACLKDFPKVRMVAISLGYTFVELDNNIMGVCFTPRPGSNFCAHYLSAGTRVMDIPGARSAILEGGGTPQFIQFGHKYTLIP